MMKYSLDQVITFIHVYECGSFTKAANKMNMSKAIVSQRISALEEHLGAQLFQRTTRKLIRTDAGTDFYGAVQPILGQIETAVERVQGHQEIAKGVLKVILPAGLSHPFREQVVPAFVSAHSEMVLELQIVSDPWAFLDKDYDVLILHGVSGNPLPPMNLVAKKFATLPAGVFATQTYLKKYGTPKKPAELIGHNCLTSFEGPWPFKRRDGAMNMVPVKGNVVANNDEVLRAMVLHDMAIGYGYPSLFKEELKSGRVVSILDKDLTGVAADIYAVFPQSYYMPYKLKAFLDVVASATMV